MGMPRRARQGEDRPPPDASTAFVVAHPEGDLVTMIANAPPDPGALAPEVTAGPLRDALEASDQDAPIVVGVDGSKGGRAAARAASSMAARLRAPLVFVYVRRGPPALLGEPYHQRRLDAEITNGRRALQDAVAIADRAGVSAGTEQLGGPPARRLLDFARHRNARMLVTGSRRRRLRRSVSRDVLRGADRPVMIAVHIGRG